MRADLHTYRELFLAGFRRQTAYRLAMFAGLATNIVFGFIRSAILFAAVESAGGELAGYSAGTISAYVWLSQGLLGAIQMNGAADVGDRVRTGDVAVDFTRPVDLQTWHLAEDMGRALYTVIPRGLPSVLVGALTFGLVMPTTVLPYVLGHDQHRDRRRDLLLRAVRGQHRRLLADGRPWRAQSLHGDVDVPGRAVRAGLDVPGLAADARVPDALPVDPAVADRRAVRPRDRHGGVPDCRHADLLARGDAA